MKESEGSVLAIAMNTRVKLIYRPSFIKDGRKDAEKQLKLEQYDRVTWLKNPTPYYIAIVSIKQDGKDIALQNNILTSLAQLNHLVK